MARTGVTYYDVEKAAVQLNQQGSTPTVDAVRTILGTGSKSTIAPLLKEWKAKQTGTMNAEQTGLPSELFTSVKNLYNGIQQLASEQIETIQNQAKTEVETAKTEALKAQKNNSNLQSQLTEYEAFIEKLKQGNESLQTGLQEEQQAHIKASTQQEAIQQRLEDRNQEIKRLNKQLDQAQQNLDHYRDTSLKQSNQERADFERQHLNLEQALKQSQQENQTLCQNLRHAENDYAKLEVKHDQDLVTNKILIDQTQQQSEEMRKAQEQLADFKSRYEAAHQANIKSELKTQALEKQVVQLEKLIAVAQDKIQTLTTSSNKAEDKIEALRSDYSILQKEKAIIEGQFKQLQHSL